VGEGKEFMPKLFIAISIAAAVIVTFNMLLPPIS